MVYSIYRNGKEERDGMKQILAANFASIVFAFAVPWGSTRVLDIWWNYSDPRVTTVLFSVSFIVWTFYYSYVTAARMLPLAKIDGDQLSVRTGIFTKRVLDLSKVVKITFQYCSEHDQRMKVKTPGEIPIEFKIMQTNCDVADLGRFITKNHNIEVSYS